MLLAISAPPARAVTPDGELANAAFGRHLAEQINRYREDQGLAPLTVVEDLTSIASEHSAAMADQRRLSHDGFRQRLLRATSKLCVENVGWNYPTAEALVDGWRRSPAHHVNLLEPKVTRMGLAVAARYVTFFACR